MNENLKNKYEGENKMPRFYGPKAEDCEHKNTKSVEVEKRCSDCKGKGGRETASGWEACDNEDCNGGTVTETVEECTDCGYRFW